MPAILNGQTVFGVQTLIPQGSNQIDDGIDIDENGVMYGSFWGIWQGRNGTHILRYRPNGSIDTLSVGLIRPNGLDYSEGSIYVANSGGGGIFKIDTLTGNKTRIVQIASPSNVIKVPGIDSLIISSYIQNKIYTYGQDSTLRVLSSSTLLNGPVGMCLDSSGNLYVSNFNNGNILKYDHQNGFQSFINIGGGIGFIAYAANTIWATSHHSKKVYKIPLDSPRVHVIAGSGLAQVQDGIGSSASFRSPNGIAVFPSGDSLYVSEYMAKCLRKLKALPTVITRLSEEKKEVNNLVYPNPTDGVVQITFPVEFGIENYLMFSPNGQEVKNYKIERNRDGLLIDLSNNSPGVYSFRLQFEDKTIIHYRIILH